ncbi:MAG: excisionase family DNA-binding protein [Brooklawnia sp.]|jgi:excisionase family DNA binding protein
MKPLSVTEAAERLGLSRQRIGQLIHSGQLNAERVGRVWVIPEQAIADFRHTRRAGVRPMSVRMARGMVDLIAQHRGAEPGTGWRDLDSRERARLHSHWEQLQAADDPASLMRAWLANHTDAADDVGRDSVDPRVARTRRRLRAAVLRLAVRQSVEDLAVEEICEAAGVSRATFYRHASSASEVLLDLMAEQLDAQRSDFVQQASGAGEALRAVHRDLISRLAAHVEEFADVYARSLASDHSVLRPMLMTHMYESTFNYVTRRKDEIDLFNQVGSSRHEFLIDALARNYAAGELGIIEAWCISGSRSRGTLEFLMLELAPAWNRQLMSV